MASFPPFPVDRRILLAPASNQGRQRLPWPDAPLNRALVDRRGTPAGKSTRSTGQGRATIYAQSSPPPVRAEAGEKVGGLPLFGFGRKAGTQPHDQRLQPHFLVARPRGAR